MTDRVTRSSRRARREGLGGPTPSGGKRFRHLTNRLEPQGAFSADHVEHIHHTAQRVLEELGIRVLHAGARQVFRHAGARVDEASAMVFIDRPLVEQALGSSPREFTMAGANTERDVAIGGRNVAFLCVGGPPHVSDLDRGKRPSTLNDMRNFLKLSQHFDVLHIQSSNVEPLDVPIQLRHLAQAENQLTLSDKPLFVYSRGQGQVADVFEMIRLARGVDEEAFKKRPCCYTVINTNSPRQLDVPMCQGIMDFARAGQVLVVTPFTLAGAMAPITMAGALTLQHAEALAGITLAQMVRPGTPVVYGSFTSNVDMKSGSPAFGTPEFIQAAFGSGQLARHIKIPWRGSAATASNVADAQATYEFLNSAWACMLGGANIMLHSAGWLESGLTASMEKFVLDIEMLQIFASLFQPLPVDEEAFAFDAIAEVEPGGHFFGSAHTMARYETAFYQPLVSDWRNFGQWSDDGAKTATMRANEIWKKVLAEFEPPALDVGRREALAEFVARRTAEDGSMPDA